MVSKHDIDVQSWIERLGLEMDDVKVDGISNEALTGAIVFLLIHKGYNQQVWKSKRLKYWDIFADRAYLALGAESLPVFMGQLAKSMSNSIGRNKIQRKIAVEIGYHVLAGEVLEEIQESHEMLVILASVMQDQIKAQYDFHEGEKEE